eukprot:3777626-Rhodomonas_salina.3
MLGRGHRTIERGHRVLHAGDRPNLAGHLLERHAVEDPDVTQGRAVHGMVRFAAQNQNRLQQPSKRLQLDRR